MWPLLTEELDRWAAGGKTATFWWRDDDAISDTAQLDALLACANGLPVALAVVPALADRSLSHRIVRCPAVTVLQHGWCHTSHVSQGLNEYPPGRSSSQVAEEFLRGRELMEELFGDKSLPVFVPPFHGFSDEYLPLLSQAGILGFSKKGVRHSPFLANLLISNTHCAPIVWSKPCSFGSDEDYLPVILDHLEGRRSGRYDSDEATGLLTHHLDQDARSYVFISELVRVVREHPAARWLDAREVFRQDACSP